MKRTIAEDVAELEEMYIDAKEANAAFAEEVSTLRHDIQDLQANLTGATREIEELYAELEYYRKVHPEIKTAWEVRQRMEDS